LSEHPPAHLDEIAETNSYSVYSGWSGHMLPVSFGSPHSVDF